jgi:hypothetical protein
MKLSSPALAGAAVCLALGLSACATDAPHTLVETKSPTQLLRNEAAQRLMGGTDEVVAEQKDYSAACKSESEDPTGLYRSWRSTLLAWVPPESSIGVDQFVGALATSFSEDGWSLHEEHGDDAASKVTTMTSTASIVTLKFTATEDDGDGASVYIEASGPCVLTAGPESDEVKDLEGK